VQIPKAQKDSQFISAILHFWDLQSQKLLKNVGEIDPRVPQFAARVVVSSLYVSKYIGKQKKLQRRSGLFGLNGLHADYKTGPKSSFIIDLTSSVNFVTTSSTIDREVLLKKKTTAILWLIALNNDNYIFIQQLYCIYIWGKKVNKKVNKSKQRIKKSFYNNENVKVRIKVWLYLPHFKENWKRFFCVFLIKIFKNF